MVVQADYAALDRAQLVERVRELERQADDFRLLMAQAPDGVFLADAQGRYIDVNAAGARMLGYSREEILCRSIPDIIIPEEVARIPEEFAKYANGAVATAEWCFLRKDGSSFLGEVVGRQFPDGRLMGILRDITERLQREVALRESESFYRQTLEFIPGMVFTTRPDGYCDYQSRQWVDYTGVPMSEHLGNGWNQLLHPDDRLRVYVAWQDAVAGRAPYDIEYRVRSHDGVYEWFQVVGRPIRDAGGRIVRWLGVAVNIERIKHAEAAMARQRDTLVREVHHRIKNHLQGVLGLMRNAMAEKPEIAGAMEGIVARIRLIAQVYGLQGLDRNQQVRLVDLMRSAAEGAMGCVPVECEFPTTRQLFMLAQEEAVPENEVLVRIRNGPAFLPAGFDYAAGKGIGTGLELLHALLPPKGATLEFRQEADEVVAELRLTAPVMLQVA
jgi:PAS domain S-box-containing protein